MPVSVAIIVPVLNEAAQLDKLIEAIKCWVADQVVVVDGGSNDGTQRQLQSAFSDDACVQVINSPAGRSLQMQCGAESASADYLLFVHADTQLPRDYKQAIRSAHSLGMSWGRFDVCFEKTGTRLDHSMRVIAGFINVRSRLSGVATGDQALFVSAKLFAHVGGFSAIPLMEDVDLCKRLKRISKPYTSRLKVITSPRRWQVNGVVRTVTLMWMLRLGFWLGVPSANLARFYANVR